jgi:predicted phosphodiesterase
MQLVNTASERVLVLTNLGKAPQPKWDTVQQAKPVVITSPKPYVKPKSKHRVFVSFPDPQIGFRFLNERWEPFHDERAMDVALQITSFIADTDRVDGVINLGDFLDLPTFGRFEQEAAFAGTTQKAFDRGHLFLQQQRAAAGEKADIVLIEGNHDRRLEKFIGVNAAAAWGLKRANADELPVMSIPYLLRLDEIQVEYIDAYPAGAYWLSKTLRAVHGNKARSNGSTAAAYTNADPHISTIFGHAHRLEIQSKTVFDRDGAIKSVAVSPGCLCRVDGAVPSVNGSTKIDGSAAKYHENWQQGILVTTIDESGKEFHELVQIDEGIAFFRGNKFIGKAKSSVA